MSCLPFSNGRSHRFLAPSCEKGMAGDYSKYRVWRLWFFKSCPSRHLDLTGIPSTLQSQTVTKSLVHLALPALNYLSYIRNKKAQLQSGRLIAI